MVPGIFSFLRLIKQPPSPRVPPSAGKIDIYSDPTAGTIKAMDDEGNEVPFSSSGGGLESAVLYTEQTLTEPQQTQALANMGVTLSSGGLGAADSLAVPLFAGDGGLVATTSATIFDDAPPGAGNYFVSMGSSAGVQTVIFFQNGPEGIFSCPTLTGSRTWTLPDTSGTMPVLPGYANSAAADAAVSFGDNWWDTTLKKSRSSVPSSTGGNSTDDSGKVPLFSATGTLTATMAVVAQDDNPPLGNPHNIQIVSTDGSQSLVCTQNTFAGTLVCPTLTASRSWTLPQDTGTVSLAQTVATETPTTGFGITASRYIDQTRYLTPAGTLATGTFTLPSATDSRAGQIVRLWSTQEITALTVNVSGGGTIRGATLSSAVADTPYAFQCVSTTGSGTWIRLQ